MLNYFPSYFSKKAIILYFVALITVSLLFFSHALPILWVLFGSVSVVGFFLGSKNLTYKWQTYSPHTFVTKLFWSALIVRIVYVIFSYFFYQWQTGQPFEFAADRYYRFPSALVVYFWPVPSWDRLYRTA